MVLWEGERTLENGYAGVLRLDGGLLFRGLWIGNDGKVRWEAVWDHTFFHAVWLPESGRLVTDRLGRLGPTTGVNGVAVLSLADGTYLERLWTEDPVWERVLHRNGHPDPGLPEWLAAHGGEESRPLLRVVPHGTGKETRFKLHASADVVLCRTKGRTWLILEVAHGEDLS